MKKFVLFALFLSAFVFPACSRVGTSSASASAKRYPLKGKVVSVNKDKRSAVIAHDDIPGYMGAMTMEFPIHEDWVWNDLTPGSEVRAELVVDNAARDPFWLERVGIIAAPDPDKPAPANASFATTGKEVPDFQLTNQDGKRISMKDFRGKALALTFIYADCPLPDYCIRMSRNFSDLANQFTADPEARNKFRLLSISFDPGRDTPEKLKSYGLGYLGKDSKAGSGVWQLAVGNDKETRAVADFFGLQYETDPNDKTQIIHSLVTAVISPEGKVTKVFTGNDWTTNELRGELERAASERPAM